jgi:hypothetical protein
MNSKHATGPIVSTLINGLPMRFCAGPMLTKGEVPFVIWSDLLKVARVSYFARSSKTRALLADHGDKVIRVNTGGRSEIAAPAWMAGAILDAQGAKLSPKVFDDFKREVDRLIDTGFLTLLAVAPAAGSA